MKRAISTLLALLISSLIAPSQEKELPPALASLVAAERAFARTSVEKGIRDSFLAFFADDGINFQPHPVNTKAAFRQRPAPPTRPPITLNWEPIYGDVAQAGDLGYTTGPYLLTDESPQKSPPQYGYFFSIWKQQADGSWKVVLDFGISTPAPANSAEHPSFQAARQTSSAPSSAQANPEAARSALIEMEREFSRAAASNGVVNAFLKYLSDDARLYRDGMFPLTEKGAIRSFLSKKAAALAWKSIRADMSRSADLGYTYGSYELTNPGSPSIVIEKGYYVHVWKREAEGRWRVVLDNSKPLPAGDK